MKKAYTILILASALAAAASCNVEESAPTARRLTFEATWADGEATRTVLDQAGTGVRWSPGDMISVFHGPSVSASFRSTNSQPAATATFEGVLFDDATSQGASYWAVYPFNPTNTCNGTGVTLTVPDAQTGVPDSFDDEMFPAVATSQNLTLSFHNVCGGVRFSLDRSDITTVTFRGNNDEDIAGEVSVTLSGGVPATTVTDGKKSVVLTPKTGTAFAAGTNYYISLLPVTLSQGFTMTFVTSGGTAGTFRYDTAPVTIGRSVFSTKASIDTYATFGRAYSKVVFIGNSITRVPYAPPLWYGNWGMAASRPENDYVHLVMDRIRQTVPSATYEIATINRWELQFENAQLPYSTNEAEMTGADLAIIRLGENVEAAYVSQFQGNLQAMCDYVHLFAPTADIVITGQFWTNPTKEAACIAAAQAKGATFVQINQFDTAQYKEAVGNYVYGIDNQLHEITDYDVARHPSDAGMRGIADAIIAAVL